MRNLREALDLTQAQFGDVVGRRVSTISAWETHDRPPPRMVITRLLERYRLPADVFEEGGPMPSAVVNEPVNELSDAEGPVESGGLPFAPEGDLLREILERPYLFTRRLETQLEDGIHPDDVLAWLDDVETILKERGYHFKKFLAACRRFVEEGS